MLVPDNIHPEQTIYFNGAFVLKAIQEHRVMDMLDLYIQTTSGREMSMPVFVLCAPLCDKHCLEQPVLRTASVNVDRQET